MINHGRNYRLDPVPGAGPWMGSVRAEFMLKDRNQQFLDQFDATYECEHGNLRGRPQKVRKCRCFQPAHQKVKARPELRKAA